MFFQNQRRKREEKRIKWNIPFGMNRTKKKKKCKKEENRRKDLSANFSNKPTKPSFSNQCRQFSRKLRDISWNNLSHFQMNREK